MMSWACS